MTEAQAIGKIVYEEVAKQQAAADTASSGAGTSAEPASTKDDDVIDAEFEVKDVK